MDICSNCYTGCTQIISDKCVRYTGLPNTNLGILTGDSINYTNSAIIGFLVSVLDGRGIKYDLAEADMCDVTSTWLTECTDCTVVDITRALSKGICTLDTRTTAWEDFRTALEAAYTVGCISVDTDAGTHDVLQATMEQVCTNATNIAAINSNLTTNYVSIADVNTYVADYVEAQNTEETIGQASKMVPFTVVEYYGGLTFFDATGAGTGDWANIYLCNGNNNTPDKRGRVAVGTTAGMGGGALASAVDPAVSGNPTYSLKTPSGSNTVTLSLTQIPSHTHTGTTNTTGAHTHTINAFSDEQQSVDNGSGSVVADQAGQATISSAGNHNHTFTTSAVGSGGAHSNIQPVLACHYIMYIPA